MVVVSSTVVPQGDPNYPPGGARLACLSLSLSACAPLLLQRPAPCLCQAPKKVFVVRCRATRVRGQWLKWLSLLLVSCAQRHPIRPTEATLPRVTRPRRPTTRLSRTPRRSTRARPAPLTRRRRWACPCSLPSRSDAVLSLNGAHERIANGIHVKRCLEMKADSFIGTSAWFGTVSQVRNASCVHSSFAPFACKPARRCVHCVWRPSPPTHTLCKCD